MIVRPAVETDVQAIKSIETEASLAPWNVKDYLAEVGRPGSHFLVAEDDEPREVIGFLLARLITRIKAHTNDNDPTSEYELLNVAVRPGEQRTGTGIMLFSAFLEQLDSEPAVIFLEVRRSNSGAIAFYRSFGFSETGVRHDFYRDPVEDALLMEARF